MGIQYLVSPEHSATFEKWHGSIKIGDLVLHWHHKLANKEAVACNRVLADLRECDIPFNGGEFRAAVRTVLDPILRGRRMRIALLVRNPVQFGMARMFSVYLQEIGEGMVFKDEVTARQWLMTSPPLLEYLRQVQGA